ncbi:MAG TPA: YbhB/YbcL family Raf kinase inhibitor-like protein [Chitinophagaceae bacterium]|nr:YbhB/YbcL family Raf kinase inhibitor-like protein [Chitinophagaceae bacterium]
MNTDTAIANLTVQSAAFVHRGNIPRRYACDGEGLNPAIAWEGVPEDADSVVLIMDDPDAPKGLFTHWLVWNIPPGAMIEENSNPGLSGTNSAGKTGYHPPCPPNGRHRYYFRMYALDMPLDLPPGSDRADLETAMHGHIIARGELMGYYEKQ